MFPLPADDDPAGTRTDVIVVPGADLLDRSLLADDGVHPSDEGHQVLAEAVGRALSAAMGPARPAAMGNEGGSR